jgi:hypothetical protein
VNTGQNTHSRENIANVRHQLTIGVTSGCMSYRTRVLRACLRRRGTCSLFLCMHRPFSMLQCSAFTRAMTEEFLIYKALQR